MRGLTAFQVLAMTGGAVLHIDVLPENQRSGVQTD